MQLPYSTMKPTLTRAAPHRLVVIRRLRWLFWIGIVVSLLGIAILFAATVLHIEYHDVGLSQFVLRCLRLRFYVAPLGIGMALSGVLGLTSLRASHFSLLSLLIWITISGLLLGVSAGVVRSFNNDSEHLSFAFAEGGFGATYDFSRQGGASGQVGIRLLFYGWNQFASWHFWTTLPFLALPLVFRLPPRRCRIVGPNIQAIPFERMPQNTPSTDY